MENNLFSKKMAVSLLNLRLQNEINDNQRRFAAEVGWTFNRSFGARENRRHGRTDGHGHGTCNALCGLYRESRIKRLLSGFSDQINRFKFRVQVMIILRNKPLILLNLDFSTLQGRSLCMQLHWLSIERRIQYKLWNYTFIVDRKAPSYLSEFSASTAASDRLQGYITSFLGVTQRRLANWAFAVAGPAAWNSLPHALHMSQSYHRPIPYGPKWKLTFIVSFNKIKRHLTVKYYPCLTFM